MSAPTENMSSKLPANMSLDINQQKEFHTKLKKVDKKVITGRAVIYVGHIPHGFFEPQMRRYFKQFGPVTNLRLSRSKKSGRSKGYAFVEFKDAAVAQIVADTMNNYLMFHRLLKCQLMAEDKVHPDMFKANRKFKRPVAAMVSRKRHNKSQSDEDMNKALKKMRQAKNKTVSKLVEMGITYDMPEALQPKRKSGDADDVEEPTAKRQKSSESGGTPKAKKSKMLTPKAKTLTKIDAPLAVKPKTPSTKAMTPKTPKSGKKTSKKSSVNENTPSGLKKTPAKKGQTPKSQPSSVKKKTPKK